MTEEHVAFDGGVDVAVYGDLTASVYRDGQVIQEETVHNLTVDSGLNLLRDLLAGESHHISKFAVGSDNTPTAAETVKLGAEVWRANITALYRGNSKQLRVTYFLPTSAANGHTIREAGIFGGAATDVADSGTLYARSALKHAITKDENVSVNFVWTLHFKVVTA